MKFHVITIFPDMFDSYLGESLFKRAQKKKIISVRTHDLRDFTTDKHKKVDDRPFGGVTGMVLKIEPLWRAVQFLESRVKSQESRTKKKKKIRTILFSTRGKKLTAQIAKRLALSDELILICGRYEGVDERVAEHVADEEISIGDYILSGGELPAIGARGGREPFRSRISREGRVPRRAQRFFPYLHPTRGLYSPKGAKMECSQNPSVRRSWKDRSMEEKSRRPPRIE